MSFSVGDLTKFSSWKALGAGIGLVIGLATIGCSWFPDIAVAYTFAPIAALLIGYGIGGFIEHMQKLYEKIEHSKTFVVHDIEKRLVHLIIIIDDFIAPLGARSKKDPNSAGDLLLTEIEITLVELENL